MYVFFGSFIASTKNAQIEKKRKFSMNITNDYHPKKKSNSYIKKKI